LYGVDHVFCYCDYFWFGSGGVDHKKGDYVGFLAARGFALVSIGSMLYRICDSTFRNMLLALIAPKC
jgi:hypothetical protein